jgi:hypothetical protein
MYRTVPVFLFACLAYLGIALPASTLGLLWPSMRLSFGEPVGALGILLVFGITASVVASAATGSILSRVRVGPLAAIGSAALPAGLGLAIGTVNAWILAPSLLILGVLMCGLYTFLTYWSGRS